MFFGCAVLENKFKCMKNMYVEYFEILKNQTFMFKIFCPSLICSPTQFFV